MLKQIGVIVKTEKKGGQEHDSYCGVEITDMPFWLHITDEAIEHMASPLNIVLL